MATVFTSAKTEYQYYLKLTLEEVVQGTATTDPQLSYKLELCSGNWDFYLLRMDAYVKLGGTVVAQVNFDDRQWTLDMQSSIILLSGTATVPHDGSPSMSVEYSIDMTQDYLESVPDITAYGDMTVTSYAKGLVYIGNGSSYDAYQVYIGNGTSWDLCIPYIGDGSNWVLCG